MRNLATGGIWRMGSGGGGEGLVAVVVVVVLLSSWVQFCACQPFVGITEPTDPSAFPVDNPAFVDYITGVVNGRMTNLTQLFVKSNLAEYSGYCIDNPQKEWDRAFNFSNDLTFVSNCIRNQGDITQRVCTAKEIDLYFKSFNLSGSAVGSIKFNKNCNRSSWVNGCEPGWGCSVNSNIQANLTDSLEIPERTRDCQSCCEGFFCPRGITCMIPCPLGSYCPLAKLNEASGVCEPYNYTLSPTEPNHTCGGANIWADVHSSGSLFCSPGSYCPTNIQQSNCSKGHYCPRGSIAEKRCFKLTSCDSSTANQKIHAYGAILIAVLATILLIIYNCSEQVLTTRERRRAKIREAAARSVKEKVQARARWKNAKLAAKKQAIELQTQVSKKFSRRKIAVEDVDELIEREPGPKDRSHSSTDPDYSSALDKSSFSSDHSSHSCSDPDHSNAPVKSPLKRKMQETEELSDTFSTESVNNSTKTKSEKEKQLHSHSQIFRYAYEELEKEKAQQQQNKNISFSGVVALATNTKIIKRPLIEISFRDLTVTLKGKNKHLLRSVTGKTRPGRITSIMGPSGAGKTTFLSALAGKAVGCTMSGLILINGKVESIHSYRKIVGFVPQDDIVHGNLTVEENLWFSACCRLSSDLQKPDKVLIVERVIESLGLLTVRSSLVGTVEKRGISGGQRKRVNVGLEMVMEPSVLFLDEPTSGLDSSSSQLLLRALRREALEGVNICMVVHQPSFTLFNMFDELILLAKGGFTVYHGPVSSVEDYFSGLGIEVPERVNPPDYYIDVLEELIKPRSGSNFHYAELPVRWMLHNGYPVPADMQKYAASLDTLPTSKNGDSSCLNDEANDEQSFAEEMWQDVKCDFQRRRDMLLNNFLRLKDLSGRRTPSVLTQYKFFLGRLGKQRLREARMQAFDLFILLVAGACLGSLSKSKDEQFGAPGYIHTIIAVSLLCKIAALRSFSLDKLQYWRESASGVSSLAHFVAKDTIDHFNTLVKPLVYLSMFYFFNNPRSSFSDNYIVLLSLVYCVTGIAYALAIFLEPGPSQLLSVLLPVILTLVATQTGDSKALKIIAELCYPKWALEAFVIANAQRYYGVWIITRCAVLLKSGYIIRDWYLGIYVLVLVGMCCRVLAFLGMLTKRKR